MVKGTRQSLPAGHLLAASRAVEVDLHPRVELAERAVEELAGGVGAAVSAGARSDALVGELGGAEGGDLVGDGVRDEGAGLLKDGARGGVGNLLVPRVLFVHGGHEEVVDHVEEENGLVGGVGVGLPKGDDLIHGGVEEGGADLREVRLDCGHSCSDSRRKLEQREVGGVMTSATTTILMGIQHNQFF